MRKLKKLTVAVVAVIGLLSSNLSALASPQEKSLRLLEFSNARSVAINSKQRTQLERFLASQPQVLSVTCFGHTHLSQSTSSKVLTGKRARAACSMVKRIQSSVSVISVTKGTRNRSLAGRVDLVFRLNQDAQNVPEVDIVAPVSAPSVNVELASPVQLNFGTWPDGWTVNRYGQFSCANRPNVLEPNWFKQCDQRSYHPNGTVPESEIGKFLAYDLTLSGRNGAAARYAFSSEVPVRGPKPIIEPSVSFSGQALGLASFNAGSWPQGWTVGAGSGIFICEQNLTDPEAIARTCSMFANDSRIVEKFNQGKWLIGLVWLSKSGVNIRYAAPVRHQVQNPNLQPSHPPTIDSDFRIGSSVNVSVGSWNNLSVDTEYSRLLLCNNPIVTSSVPREFNGAIRAIDGCLPVGAVRNLPTTIQNDWQGKYLGAVLHLVGGGTYYEYILGVSNIVQGSTPTNQAPQAPGETTPPPGNNSPNFLDYQSRRPGANYCRYDFPNGKYISGKVEIPTPSDFTEKWGTSKTMYQATFIQHEDGGYATNALGYRYWRDNYLENWKLDTANNPVSWTPVVNITCRVQN